MPRKILFALANSAAPRWNRLIDTHTFLIRNARDLKRGVTDQKPLKSTLNLD